MPFVAGYLAVIGLDPAGVLVPFGLARVAVGLSYRTPLGGRVDRSGPSPGRRPGGIVEA